ncbi:DUF6223 family protein [Paenibacillus allorhizosphaerae]|uniref:Integral membrane protein n=1 Tax=Paenibacillus allorhizosphaerae TaxID=2849866 RepID=A0ABM8VU78_9BACL|nr:DUF6223 family protein [Paenibacillus allorhizosphaerae]CAG7658686.1 hypothetical protein PAECIP111802_07127 [Paenibacillus allorhizosphaerae]
MKMKLVSFGILCTILLKPTIASAEMVGGGDEMTIEQLKAIVVVVIGLISVVISRLAMARSIGLFGNGNGRNWSIVAIVIAVFSIYVGGRHLFDTTGFFGTGYGQAGSIVAIVLGLIGVVLAYLTLVRSRRKS